MLAIALLFSCFVVLRVTGHSGPDASSHGEDIPGSQYSLFQGQVYVSSNGDGSYVVSGADAQRFKPLDSRYDGYRYGYALGQDGQRVYCGDQAIAGLRPEAVNKVFGGYLSDGRNAWFCGRPADNLAYRWWQELLLSHEESDPDRVKRYRFPLTTIEAMDVAALHPVFDEYVSDDRHLFYRGRQVAGSDGRNAQPITYQSVGERKAVGYLKDTRAVYYNGVPLADVKPGDFSVFDVENSDLIYGRDALSGSYWLEGKRFPDIADGVDARNLSVLLADRTQAYHELFANPQGIFFWDSVQDRLRHACSMPTTARLRPVPGLTFVFQDEQSLYVVSSGEARSSSRGGGSIVTSWHTRLYRLRDVTPDQLHRTGEIRIAHDRLLGNVWQAGALTFFQPTAGTRNQNSDALYLVSDLPKLQSFAAQSPDRELRRWDVLEPIAGDKICDAETEHFPYWPYFWMAVLAVIAVSSLASKLRLRKRMKR